MMRLIAGAQQSYAQLPGSLDDGHVAALKQVAPPTARLRRSLSPTRSALMVACIIGTALVPLLRKVVPPKPPSINFRPTR
ncbi:MAG: hypothetical protein J2P48_04765 [Alphaproteobacteria bacterium]|nr:hypothetical protein [Alphaproteobacteria bacterium]